MKEYNEQALDERLFNRENSLSDLPVPSGTPSVTTGNQTVATGNQTVATGIQSQTGTVSNSSQSHLQCQSQAAATGVTFTIEKEKAKSQTASGSAEFQLFANYKMQERFATVVRKSLVDRTKSQSVKKATVAKETDETDAASGRLLRERELLAAERRGTESRAADLKDLHERRLQVLLPHTSFNFF